MTTHITQTTHCFTLQQLRAATQAGGVAGVSLKGHGNGFFIQIQLRTGQQAVLITARSRSPRMFKSPVQAFGVLRRVGIVTGSFDITHYVPEQQQTDNDKPTKQAAKTDDSKTKTKAVKAPRAKKTANQTPVVPTSTAEHTVSVTKPKQKTASTTQSSMTEPSIQKDETQSKELTEEQTNKSSGVQQSLI